MTKSCFLVTIIIMWPVVQKFRKKSRARKVNGECIFRSRFTCNFTVSHYTPSCGSSRQFSGSPLSSCESVWPLKITISGDRDESCQPAELRWYYNWQSVSRVRVEFRAIKRLVYTLHPKAMTLRTHSMRKRRVTTKFTMVKKSKKTGGASWYYKIHPTHRRNTTQIL